MVVDPVAGPPLDVAHDRAPAGVVDVAARPHVRADDVVVMDRLAGDVGVLAGRQVEALDGVQIGQDVERPEDRRPADAEASGSGVGDQIGRGEVPGSRRDQLGDRPPGAGQPIAGVVEGGLQRRRLGHAGQMILSIS